MSEDLGVLQAQLASLKAQLAEFDKPQIGPPDQMDLAVRLREIPRLHREISDTEAKIAQLKGGAPSNQSPLVQEADADAKLAGELFTGATKAAAPPPAPSGAAAPKPGGGPNKGCLAGAGIGVILVILILITALSSKDDDDSATTTECPSTTAGAAGDLDLQHISFQQSCASDEEDEEDEDGEEADADSGLSPPKPEDVPAGAILFQGSSGGPIGCIPCDGQSRFLSLEANTTAVGNAAANSVATTWVQDGQIVEFGARLGAPNLGRYGVNFFYLDTFEYGPGVSLETGEQSMVFQWTPERDGTVHAGRPVAIIVGEGGNLEATGEYELEWWFVFQPD